MPTSDSNVDACCTCGAAVDCFSPYRLEQGPGAYDVRNASRQCLKSAPAVAFGGSLNRVDREKTGPLKVAEDKGFVPGPCSYAFEAEEQVTMCYSMWVLRDSRGSPKVVPLLSSV